MFVLIPAQNNFPGLARTHGIKALLEIIDTERPDALLPTMGGQTALNCALDLEREGVLEKFGVEMIGANADTIDKAEDRSRFERR